MADPQGNAFDPTMQPGPQGQATDVSQPGALRQMWDNWTSRPENNAAMINFGLQMMQPVPAGQSRMGHFGEALGAGLEAGGRVSSQEEARQKVEEEEALKERAMGLKEEETGIYGQDVRSKIAQRALGAQGTLRAQAAWNKYMNSPAQAEDLTADPNNPVSKDTVLQRIREMDPKRWGKYTKSQMLNDPVASAAAQNLFGAGPGGAGGGGLYREGATATGPDGQKIIYRGGRWTPLSEEE